MSARAKHAYGIATFVMLAGFCSTAPAHMAFKKNVQQKYPGMKVNCNACHIKGKPKTDRNDFGKLFAKELKASNPTLTEEWKSKKGAEKKKYESSEMVPAFDKALAKVKTLTNDKQEVYDDLIKSGQIPFIEKDPKYKPDSKTDSGGSQAATETKVTNDEKHSSDKTKEESNAESESEEEGG